MNGAVSISVGGKLCPLILKITNSLYLSDGRNNLVQQKYSANEKKNTAILIMYFVVTHILLDTHLTNK